MRSGWWCGRRGGAVAVLAELKPYIRYASFVDDSDHIVSVRVCVCVWVCVVV